MTGMRVIPMTTVSGPASSDEGVVMPWLMWCSGLAESSSPLMTATGPAQTMRDKGPGEVASTQNQPCPRNIHCFAPISSRRIQSIRSVSPKFPDL